ncbi:MAG: hypothetical protein AAFS10_12130, partial [Myxococcota bacterium]
MWSSVLMRSVVALLLALAVAVAAGVSESPQARADGALPAASSRSKVSDFTLKDIKDAIPGRCFEPSTARSLSYMFLDFGIVAALYALAHNINSWLF